MWKKKARLNKIHVSLSHPLLPHRKIHQIGESRISSIYSCWWLLPILIQIGFSQKVQVHRTPEKPHLGDKCIGKNTNFIIFTVLFWWDCCTPEVLSDTSEVLQIVGKWLLWNTNTKRHVWWKKIEDFWVKMHLQRPTLKTLYQFCWYYVEL